MTAIDPTLLRVLAQRLWERRCASADAAEPAVSLAPDECARALQFWVNSCRRAWPLLDVPWEEFFEHLFRHLPADKPLTELEHIWHVEDLYLAFACSRADAGALGMFFQLYEPDLRAAVARLRARADLDEVRQTVAQRMFASSPTGAPKVLEYSGRGELRAWFRVAVVRTLLDRKRAEKGRAKTLEEHQRLGFSSAPNDPETAYFKRLYREEFEQALRVSVQQLEAAERNVLRGYFAEDLTVDQLASALGIHRATAARRVSRAKDRLLELTRAELRRQLALSPNELESVLRLIKSQLHLSVRRLFDSR